MFAHANDSTALKKRLKNLPPPFLFHFPNLPLSTPRPSPNTLTKHYHLQVMSVTVVSNNDMSLPISKSAIELSPRSQGDGNRNSPPSLSSFSRPTPPPSSNHQLVQLMRLPWFLCAGKGMGNRWVVDGKGWVE